jgi:hypothetical protein
MQRRVGAYFVLAFACLPWQQAAASMPEIKTGATNRVPECATPGRMTDFLRRHNPDLDAHFEGLAMHYMRLGEELGVRWDYAFFQMIIETGWLSFKRGNRSGDVRPAQNNFAGLGATGGGQPGETFKDMATGVRAHLEHLLLYAGDHIANPTAERTRKVQEWNVLTSWQAKFKRPLTYSDLAAQWAPGSASYARMFEAVAERFEEVCALPDPRPELVAEARGQTRGASAPLDHHASSVADERPTGVDLARRAIDEGKSEQNERRSALGVKALDAAAATFVPFRVLNGAPAAEDQAALANNTAPPRTAKAGDRDPQGGAQAPGARTGEAQGARVAGAGPSARALAQPQHPAVGQKCRVWTASYGGQKAILIQSTVDKVVNYTVLDVNEGQEAREARAFIEAYAKEGSIAGEFATQSQALDKAFELCPEG